ncbi:MAG: hypothetical protein ABR595_03905 [Psychroflexus sp.]
MMTNNKALVQDFFYSNYYHDKSTFEQFIHPDLMIDWSSSTGFYRLNFKKFSKMALDMGKSFQNMSPQISHLLEEDNKVCVRFTYNVETLESEDLISLADFFCIWEIKDNKLYKGYIMSQPCDDGIDGMLSFINES